MPTQTLLEKWNSIAYPAPLNVLGLQFSEGVTEYLLCALERKVGVSGLLFCDRTGDRQDGSPIQTGFIEDRVWVEEYELIIASDGVYVVAHRSHENGTIDPIVRWH